MTKLEWAKAAKVFGRKCGNNGLKMLFYYILGLIGFVKAIDTGINAGRMLEAEDICNGAANTKTDAEDSDVVISGISFDD